MIRSLRIIQVLQEIHATGGDIRRIWDLARLSVEGAQRYANPIAHPDIEHPPSPVPRTQPSLWSPTFTEQTPRTSTVDVDVVGIHGRMTWKTPDMEIDVLFAGVPIADLAAATGWYEQLFGRPPDMFVNENDVMWRIADGAWLYLVVDPARAGQALVAMAVAHLDDMTATIEERGLDITSIETIPGAGRKAYFVDPDGNSIAFIEVLQQD